MPEFPPWSISERLQASLRRLGQLTAGVNYGHMICMATATIRSTYALRIETVRQLNLLAERWGVSKSEALRRAVSEAALRAATGVNLTPVEALERLQTTEGISPQRAAAFAAQVRRERREYKRVAR